ncbi:molybdopterin-binding protein [Chitinivorax sp. PXF-14]|uniref:competence/damage-inducible protein A n=1 Tax=Chitinivorax sp. PXF-14 TaxID=3230488 RepID=UPI0034663F04
MAFGALIIGDEILSGKREDKHLRQVIATLKARGLDLAWADYLGDEPERITATLRRTMQGDDIVFSFGGIGATPDDYTRQCAAMASGRALGRHPEASRLIEARFGAEAYPNRILMAELPRDCELIPNPVNQIAGFSIAHHHFLPGFPSMAWPMMEWVLDQRYPHLFRTDPPIELALIAIGAREGNLIPLMNDFVTRYPMLRFSSLPSFGDDTLPAHIEFGLRGPRAEVETAMAEWAALMQEQGFECHPKLLSA